MTVRIVEGVGNDVDLSCELKHCVLWTCKCCLWREGGREKWMERGTKGREGGGREEVG